MPDEKKKSYMDLFGETWDEMKSSGGCVGPFMSPMGHGVVIKAGSEYNDGVTEHHHFLTHDAEGKALKKPKHFVQTEREPMKTENSVGKTKKG